MMRPSSSGADGRGARTIPSPFISPRGAFPKRDARVTLLAQCSNCASWRHTADHGHVTASNVGFCGRGLFPPQGQLLCQQYQASAQFRQDIISSMLKDHGPMAMPVKLVGGRRSAKELTRKRK